ncbi:MAG: glycine cleavage system aminomethyltransferase GcvT [Anaerolineales bacterium]|nr:glycine cleavage system aminomethyltransferase GcvT [Anaerolineales bacterium]
MSDFIVHGTLQEVDQDLYDLTRLEGERQHRKLILIPSESTAAMAVREALSSSFQNVYAEGYPPADSIGMTQDEILDYEMRLAEYRRYSDPRYYKGVEYADTLEALARRRCSEAFAANGITPEKIFVNVQALSGAPANNAVYHALVEPGDTVMGMNLLHGGHLSHGSPVNRSGKYYNIVHYGVDPVTEKIDYDKVEEIAREHKPKMIIAGFSSYSWIPDWKRFREIAEAVGAYFLADIAHIAGMVAAGVIESPLGYADVVTFTTHKSLCGPRGAAILTTSKKLAGLIDRAVFPGEQGGPHLNTIAAQAVAFKLARTDRFIELQKQALKNSKVMVETLQKEGLRISFGGTNSHLLNIDCKSVVGPDGTTLSGDQAARILDIAGIVANRNTIPGDTSALRPSGVRMGTHWITERGFKEKGTAELASLIAELLKACVPYSIAGKKRPQQRAKVDFSVLNKVKNRIRDLAENLALDFVPTKHGYPHFYYLDDEIPAGNFARIGFRSPKTAEILRWVTSAVPEEIAIANAVECSLTAQGDEIAVVLERTAVQDFKLYVSQDKAGLVLTWLRDLSDGYVAFDEDVYRKIPGPFVVELEEMVSSLPDVEWGHDGMYKPWFIGASDENEEALPDFIWEEKAAEKPRRTALYETHKAMGAKLVDFAGWEMPVRYSSVLEEHLATREAAGLFDVSHMGVYEVEGPSAAAFLDGVVGNDVFALAVGESHYTQFLDPDGNVIDDTMVYRRGDELFLVVVNASNDDKDWAWLNAVKNGDVCVDRERPWAKAFGRDCALRNLRDPKEGDRMRVDIAIQGPKSREILQALGTDEKTSQTLTKLPWAGVMEGVFGGIDLIVSRTGYTGERIAYELFVHPDKSENLWKKLLEVGEPLGLKPVGLGARDSLRTEAGLPLYGHEMAGGMNLGVGDAGFAAYVKTYKPWFIGRQAFMQQEAERSIDLVRFRFLEKSVRMAHNGDPVVDDRGRIVGKVTSCAIDSEGYILGQAVIDSKLNKAGTILSIFQGAAENEIPAVSDISPGKRITVPSQAEVLTRFPK